MRWFVVLAGIGACTAPLGIEPTLPDSVDPDHDGFADNSDDNCPGVANPSQADSNGDGVGDACSTFCTGVCHDAMCACADFDDSMDIPAGWKLMTEGTSAGAVNTGDVRSPPNALSMHVPTGPTTGMRNLATFSQGILATKLHIIFETDWKLSYFRPTDDGHDVQFVSVYMENIANVGIGHDYNPIAGEQWSFGMAVLGIGNTSWPISPPPTDAATWVHVSIDVLFDPAGNGHAYLTLGKDEVVHKDNLVSAPPISGQHTLSAVANAWALNGIAPDLQVTYDNLVMHVE